MSSSHVHTQRLRRTTTPEEYRVYRAGLEWDLTDPIVIEKREDLKSESRWRDLLEPYHHQVTNLITFCRRLPVTLLADDVGLGKTISAGLIMSELIARARLSKILVVCPKLLGPQWQEELLTKFNIPSVIATGKELIDAEPEATGAIITTYHSARLHLEAIPQDRFQMLVLDEAHQLRNLYGVSKPPQVALRFRQALEARRFRFVLMLTATPIQNRLWDLYSLIDLLTVARGHPNPFGDESRFARKFIADSRDKARQLKPEAHDEFRSIVYGYLSRVRRGDARLYFPDRVVHRHEVDATPAEIKLLQTLTGPIQKLNRLAQISILQALTSSPEALTAQVDNMASRGTVSRKLAATVRAIVADMPPSAKLRGLGGLIERLKREQPERWRLVVFTGRLETQTAIQTFLEQQGLTVGIINGTSGPRNQETLARFRHSPPDCHIIVSTEAGAEGINLQVANVLVNYDLPWNPMIVEQRIGRIQRLASEHKSVGIFNLTLRDTFEAYIVGRLMEKLQMASHAIGDIEALLEASGISGEEEGRATGFDEKIRQLVMAALAGKDVEAATRQAEQSIAEAKRTLEGEEAHINQLLGGMDEAHDDSPLAPTLPPAVRSMGPREFTLAALHMLGARVTPQAADLYLVEEDGRREHIRFDDPAEAGVTSTLYAPGTTAFLRLVGRVIATGVYDVDDLDRNPAEASEDLARRWVLGFGGTPKTIEVDAVHRHFAGTALVRVRATVAHDSYERLVEVPCAPEEHRAQVGRAGLGPLPNTVETPSDCGIDVDRLVDTAEQDEAISAFSRFYVERRAQEVRAAGSDERKSKKLEDEFTPRLDLTLAALTGRMHRRFTMRVHYQVDADHDYQDTLRIAPHRDAWVDAPELGRCTLTGQQVPQTCLDSCQITGAVVLRHLLVRSEISSRLALPDYTVRCSLSGQRVLQDEAELSAVSGRLVATALMKTSAVSGKWAEPEHFGRCEWTQAEVLHTELATSEVSGKRYRIDAQTRSVVSGKTGHPQEFVLCYETRQPLLESEAEVCEETGHAVRPGVLEPCAVTQQRVLPSELARCTTTGKRALKRLLVTSSVSGARILDDVAVRSATGKACAPSESKTCLWSGRTVHPDDLRVCELTGLPMHVDWATADGPPRLRPLVELLSGSEQPADEPQLWDAVAAQAAAALRRGRCRVVAAGRSPDGHHLAVCAEVRTLLGLRVHRAGFVYAIGDQAMVGGVVQGRLTSKGWSGFKS